MTIKEYIKQAIEYLKTGKATPEFMEVDKYVGDILVSILSITIILTIAIITVKRKRKKREKEKSKKTLSEMYKETNYYIETQQIENDVFYNKGDHGQYLISLKLEKIEGYHKTVYNLNVPTITKCTEIDIVFITNSGIYVIESKNYSGYIYGNPEKNQWTQTLPSYSGINKNKFYNPIWQNDTHIEALKKHLNEYKDIKFYSLIIFGDGCTLKTEGTENIVINTKDTIETINRIKKEPKLSNEDVDNIYNKLRTFSCWHQS